MIIKFSKKSFVFITVPYDRILLKYYIRVNLNIMFPLLLFRPMMSKVNDFAINVEVEPFQKCEEMRMNRFRFANQKSRIVIPKFINQTLVMEENVKGE